MNPDLLFSCLSLGLRLAGIGVVINAAETLVARREYAPDGLYSWDMLRTSYRLTARRPLCWLVDPLCGETIFLALVAGQVLAGAYLVVGGGGGFAAVAVAYNLAVYLLFNFRNQSGLDGADQMQLLFHAGALACLISPGALGRECGMVFIVFQSALSYLTAGLAKVRSKTWRSGAAVVGIWSTKSYGLACTARWLKHSPGLSLALSWTTIIFELAMPFLVLLGPSGAMVYLLAGTAFHLVNAVVMGLNGFLWAFVAGYPAVWYIANRYFA